jgi:recombination protein RecR
MSVIEELTEIFRRFPGVGPRQAERFVYYLLRQRKDYLHKMASLIPELENKTKICDLCQKFYISETDQTGVCKICSSKNRDQELLMIIARDADLHSVEKSGTFNGNYFILGGTVPVLDKEPAKRIRLGKLKKVVEKRRESGLKEIIIALSANPEGENTADILKKELQNMASNEIKITLLGRGLSTGTELEYSDSETIKNALLNRF